MPSRIRRVRRVLLITLTLNLGVAALKIVWGILGNSVGMISDGYHSLFDGVSNVVGIIGVWLASHPPDAEHPYGHSKYETLSTVIISGMIFAACFQVLSNVFTAFTEGHGARAEPAAFVVMLVTLGINVFVMIYEERKGRELKSDFLKADSRHTKSDVFTSLGVIAGLVFTRLGYPIADTLVGLGIAVFIARVGLDVLKRASGVLLDEGCLNTSEVARTCVGVEGVRSCHKIRSRGLEHTVFVDLHIQVDPAMSIEEAHAIAGAVKAAIKAAFPEVVDVIVHAEPDSHPAHESRFPEAGP